MAEWFVDPENGLTTNDGTSVNAPWKLIPGQTGASSQTGYTLAAGDTINIRTGTTTTAQVSPPANNLIYRGYGLSSNRLSLPGGLGSPAREVGVHEGMWTIDANGATTFGMFFLHTRTGVTVEDMEVLAPGSNTAVSLGVSNTAVAGFTMRRCKVTGAAQTGIASYALGLNFEDVLVENTDDDGIIIGATLTNGYRAGYSDSFCRVAMVNCGLGASGVGDGFQTLPADGRFESRLEMSDIYVYKSVATKQGLVLADMLGGGTIRRFFIDGPVMAQGQILLYDLRGHVLITEGEFAGACAGNAAIRIITGTEDAMATGSSVVIQAVMVTASSNVGLLALGNSDEATNMDGAIHVRNCYVGGINDQNASFVGAIALHEGANVTYGLNASCTVSNNIIEMTGNPAINLPTGVANDSAWVVQNNCATPGSTYRIGSTDYATLALFEAAHNAAVNNVEADPLLDASYRLTSASPCKGAGVYLENAKHYGSCAMNPVAPDIGAHRWFDARTVVARSVVQRTAVSRNAVILRERA